jgi:hypothetical protein
LDSPGSVLLRPGDVAVRAVPTGLMKSPERQTVEGPANGTMLHQWVTWPRLAAMDVPVPRFPLWDGQSGWLARAGVNSSEILQPSNPTRRDTLLEVVRSGILATYDRPRSQSTDGTTSRAEWKLSELYKPRAGAPQPALEKAAQVVFSQLK